MRILAFLLCLFPFMEAFQKQIVFLRHGCTYMNEYLGNSIAFGAPHFSDVFEAHHLPKYRDSPLSPLGISQAKALARSQPSFLQDCELIVTSPLTRALQTLHHGLKPHLDGNIPVVALPEAAERLYLISDVGKPISDVQRSFHYVDFETGFENKPKEVWWYKPMPHEKYVEWRPSGQGQRYAVPGEPQEAFDRRMTRLYEWLRNRPEAKIAVVCHWGVIDWMCDMDFDNCQWREMNWNMIQPRAFQSSSQQ